jgi:hypothetical protein
LPSKAAQTLKMTAKAAVAVYEAAVDEPDES